MSMTGRKVRRVDDDRPVAQVGVVLEQVDEDRAVVAWHNRPGPRVDASDWYTRMEALDEVVPYDGLGYEVG